MVGGLQVDVAVELMGVGVIILVVAVGKILFGDVRMSCISEVAEVVAVEVLQREAADDVPQLVLVVGVPHEAIGVLRETFLADEVCLLDIVAVCVLHAQTKLREFVVRAELLVVAVAIGIVQRGGCGPTVVDGPRSGEDVVVLPEVIGGLVPIAAVGHLVALGGVGIRITFCLLFQRRDDQLLVQ